MNLDAAKIRTIAFAKGKTQKSLVSETGISQPTINKAFTGKNIRWETAKAIADAMELDVTELIEVERGRKDE